MEEFFCKTHIISGRGSLSRLKDLGIGRLMLVTDPFFAKNGTAQKIATLSGATHYEIFDRVEPDPSVDLAAAGTARVREFQPDTIVALGGGSAMDCAKAMAYFSGSPVRLVAVPTTSGSGSEVTDFAILTHGQVKHPLVDEALRPEVAILDGDLTEGLPKSLIADGGFDILSHALEACVGKKGGAITEALAQSAFRIALSRLPASFGGDKTVRQSIHEAATMAGIAFSQAGLGICHALSHSLGGAFHLPHGRLNAILLPAVIANNGATAAYARMARAAGLEGSADTVAVRNLQNALTALRKTMHLPATLAQAGISPGQVRPKTEALVKAALEDPCCATNPIPVTAGLTRKILEEVTGRG